MMIIGAMNSLKHKFMVGTLKDEALQWHESPEVLNVELSIPCVPFGIRYGESLIIIYFEERL